MRQLQCASENNFWGMLFWSQLAGGGFPLALAPAAIASFPGVADPKVAVSFEAIVAAVAAWAAD